MVQYSIAGDIDMMACISHTLSHTFLPTILLQQSCVIIIVIIMICVLITFICVICSVQDHVLSFNEGSSPVHEALLEGHLGVTRELLLFQTAQKKFVIGSQKQGPNLIKVKKQET